MEGSVPLRSGGTAPYAPPTAVLAFIEAFRNRPVPTPFTTDVYVRAGVPDSLAPRVAKSLEGLDLVDADGNPTAELEGLRRAPAEEYRQRLAAIIRAVYAEVFQFIDPAADTPERIADQFRVFEPIGQRGRMVTLFLGLCAAAGIISEQPKKQAAATVQRAPRPKGRITSVVPESLRRAASVSARAQLRNDQDRHLPTALTGLLGAIPSPEVGWTQQQRNGFVAAFSSVLDFCIPIIEPPREVPYETLGQSDDDGDE
jgi:hypothetical protein